MKSLSTLPFFAALLLGSISAHARDEHLSLPLKEALETPAAQSKLDKGVKLYFGKQKHPRTAGACAKGRWQCRHQHREQLQEPRKEQRDRIHLRRRRPYGRSSLQGHGRETSLICQQPIFLSRTRQKGENR